MMEAMKVGGADRPGETAMQPLRSFLFAPGNHARRVEKALSLDADAVILDLEDAVAIAEKRATRDAVIGALGAPAATAALCPRQCGRHRVLLRRSGGDRPPGARRSHSAEGRKRRWARDGRLASRAARAG